MADISISNSIIVKKPYKPIIAIIVIWTFLFSIMPLDFAYGVPVPIQENQEAPPEYSPEDLINLQNDKEALIEQKNDLLNPSYDGEGDETDNDPVQLLEAGADPIPGDFNENGLIDYRDYCIWRNANGSHKGDPYYVCDIDLNQDDVIDIQDYIIMSQSYYGQEGFGGQQVGDFNNDGNLDKQDLELWQNELNNSQRGDDRYLPTGDMNFDDVICDEEKDILLEVLGIEDTSPGDLDGNGVIDYGDYELWQEANGSRDGDPNFNPDADLNVDGVIDIADYIIITEGFYEQEGFGGQQVGDLDQNDVLNFLDQIELGDHFGSQRGDPYYLPIADLNFDDVINEQDELILLDILSHQGYISGDLNGDGWIDSQDYAIWSVADGSQKGDPYYVCDIDLNQDDVIDIQDYIIMSQSYYGQEGFGGQQVGDFNNDGNLDKQDLELWQNELNNSQRGDDRYLPTGDMNFDDVICDEEKDILLEVLGIEDTSPGDLDGNGVIDYGDYELWQEANGSRDGDPNFNPDADLNVDGVIDIADYIIITEGFYEQEGFGGQQVGDLDQNDVLNFLDQIELGDHFGSQRGDPYYLPIADLNFDDVINEQDELILLDILSHQGYISGDLNGDGWIDSQDYAIWSVADGSQIGDANYDSAADLNGDDFVNFDDYLLMLADWYCRINYDFSPGDVDGNQQLNVMDLMSWQSLILSEAEYRENRQCDFNFDDSYGENDRQILIRLLVHEGYGQGDQPADVNHNGIIEADDFQLWITAQGSVSGDLNYCGNCDLNGDGHIDSGDLLMMVRNTYDIYGFSQVDLLDINADGVINASDIIAFAHAYGTLYPQSDYTIIQDLNLDSEINEIDLYIFALLADSLGLGDFGYSDDFLIFHEGDQFIVDRGRWIGFIYDVYGNRVGQYINVPLNNVELGENVNYISLHFNQIGNQGQDDTDSGLVVVTKESDVLCALSCQEADYENALYKSIETGWEGCEFSVIVHIGCFMMGLTIPENDFFDASYVQYLFEQGYLDNVTQIFAEGLNDLMLSHAEAWSGDIYYESVFQSFRYFYEKFKKISQNLHERVVRFLINSGDYFTENFKQSPFSTAMKFFYDFVVNQFGLLQPNGQMLWLPALPDTLIDEIVTVIETTVVDILDWFCNYPSQIQNKFFPVLQNIYKMAEHFNLSVATYRNIANFFVLQQQELQNLASVASRYFYQMSFFILERNVITNTVRESILDYLVPAISNFDYSDVNIIFSRQYYDFQIDAITANRLIAEIIDWATRLSFANFSSKEYRYILAYVAELIQPLSDFTILDALIEMANPQIVGETDIDYAVRLSVMKDFFSQQGIIVDDPYGALIYGLHLIDIIAHTYSQLPEVFRNAVKCISFALKPAVDGFPRGYATGVGWILNMTAEEYMTVSDFWIRHFITHETAHVIDNQSEYGPVERFFLRLYDESIDGFPMTSDELKNFISAYAATNLMEDFAVSAEFWAFNHVLQCFMREVDESITSGPTLLLEKLIFTLRYFRNEDTNSTWYLFQKTQEGLFREELPVEICPSTGRILSMNTGDWLIRFEYDSEGRLANVQKTDLSPEQRIMTVGDTDQDSVLTYPEWRLLQQAAEDHLGVDIEDVNVTKPALLRALDFDRDGYITHDDLAVLESHEPQLISVTAFKALDTNGDLQISDDEVIKGLQAFGKTYRKSAGQDGYNALYDFDGSGRVAGGDFGYLSSVIGNLDPPAHLEISVKVEIDGNEYKLEITDGILSLKETQISEERKKPKRTEPIKTPEIPFGVRVYRQMLEKRMQLFKALWKRQDIRKERLHKTHRRFKKNYLARDIVFGISPFYLFHRMLFIDHRP